MTASAQCECSRRRERLGRVPAESFRPHVWRVPRHGAEPARRLAKRSRPAGEVRARPDPGGRCPVPSRCLHDRLHQRVDPCLRVWRRKAKRLRRRCRGSDRCGVLRRDGPVDGVTSAGRPRRPGNRRVEVHGRAPMACPAGRKRCSLGGARAARGPARQFGGLADGDHRRGRRRRHAGLALLRSPSSYPVGRDPAAPVPASARRVTEPTELMGLLGDSAWGGWVHGPGSLSRSRLRRGRFSSRRSPTPRSGRRRPSSPPPLTRKRPRDRDKRHEPGPP
jgi:hypothetical protein